MVRTSHQPIGAGCTLLWEFLGAWGPQCRQWAWPGRRCEGRCHEYSRSVSVIRVSETGQATLVTKRFSQTEAVWERNSKGCDFAGIFRLTNAEAATGGPTSRFRKVWSAIWLTPVHGLPITIAVSLTPAKLPPTHTDQTSGTMATLLKRLSVSLDRRAGRDADMVAAPGSAGGMANSPSFNDFSLHVGQDGELGVPILECKRPVLR